MGRNEPGGMKNRLNQYIEKAFFTLILAVLSFTANTIKDMSHQIGKLSNSIGQIMNTIQSQDEEIKRIAKFEERIIRVEERQKLGLLRLNNVEIRIGIKSPEKVEE